MSRKHTKAQSAEKRRDLSLRTRLVLLVGAVVLASIIIAFGLAKLLEILFPFTTNIPLLIQLNIFSLTVAMVATRFLSKLFFEPIKVLREGMKKVADGDFNTRLETASSSSEIQELFSGFNLMTGELQSTEILQTDFVSNVSHEFKTPINAIEGYATLLQGTENIDEVENEYIEKILFNTRRLSTLVSNILLLSKLENQTIQTHQELYGLDEQVREAIVALEPAWEAKEIDFDIALDDLEFYGNENMMYHVWSNIIGNAVKFSPQGGKVKIRLRKKDTDSIIFTVDDEGPGLSEETQKHLFDKFYQEDSSHKQEGNGLGLALAKRILTISHGEISAENLESGGCRFTVILHTAQ